MKPKVIAIVGPTASGKSDLAVKIAKEINGEVISADSRQIYKGLDIGTGKIKPEEMHGIAHHMLDVWDPVETISVSDYVEVAREKIIEIISRNHIPIVCGGTGMYIDSLLFGITYPKVEPNITLREKLEEKSTEDLFVQLQKQDPKRAQGIDKFNRRRLIRALEIFDSIGSIPEKRIELPYDVLWVGVASEQSKLENKILNRLKSRIKEGMITEAEDLYKNGLSFDRMEVLGLEYRYLAKFLKKEIDLTTLESELFIAIRQYAKRQMTWFKKNKEIQWFDPENAKTNESIRSLCKKFLN